MDSQTALARLDAARLDPTPQRARVLELLAATQRPLAAREILDALRRDQPINKVTLYRILDLFVERQLAQKVHGGEKETAARYCLRQGPAMHGHFYCRGCGSLECLVDRRLSLAVQDCLRDWPFRVEAVDIRLEGLCPACAVVHPA